MPGRPAAQGEGRPNMPTDAMRHVFRVISTAEYVPLARRETSKILHDWQLNEEVVFTACLIVTELVTNVARHAAVLSPTASVTLTVDQDTLMLAVCDAHPFRPKDLHTEHDLGGR